MAQGEAQNIRQRVDETNPTKGGKDADDKDGQGAAQMEGAAQLHWDLLGEEPQPELTGAAQQPQPRDHEGAGKRPEGHPPGPTLRLYLD